MEFHLNDLLKHREEALENLDKRICVRSIWKHRVRSTNIDEQEESRVMLMMQKDGPERFLKIEELNPAHADAVFTLRISVGAKTL